MRARMSTIAIDLSGVGRHDARAPEATLRVTVAGSSMDRELVERARGGDADAFSLLCRQIGDRLFAISYNILGERGAAEDAAQVAMIDLWRSLPKLRDVSRFDAWSYRVVVNAAYAEGGRLKRLVPAPASLRPVESIEGDHAQRLAVRDELERAMRRLTMDQRTVLVLKHVADLPNEEIATILQIPVGTVRSRLHHAQGQLRAAMAAESRTPAGGTQR